MTFSRIALIAVAVVAMASGFGPAFAIADAAARIKQCVVDNKDETQTATVVAAYCSCMNNKMSDSETQSITPGSSQRAKGLLRERANRRSRLAALRQAWLVRRSLDERLRVRTEIHEVRAKRR